mgnify:CR=1 FL=1
MLAGNDLKLFGRSVQQFNILNRFTKSHVQDNFFKPGNLHDVFIIKRFGQLRNRFFLVKLF